MRLYSAIVASNRLDSGTGERHQFEHRFDYHPQETGRDLLANLPHPSEPRLRAP
jgi:hypothetical protein